MKKINIFKGILALLVIVLLAWTKMTHHTQAPPNVIAHTSAWRTQPAAGDTSTPKPARQLTARDRKAVDIISAIYSASINLHGRVEDERGKPVGGALVEYSLNDKYFKDGSKGTTTSGANGAFVIQGKGASVYVRVQKKGYYLIPDRSNASIRADQPTSPNDPAVFVLKKAGTPQVLTHNKFVTRHVPINGTPMEVHLSNTNLVMAGSGHLRIEAWVTNAKPGQVENYQWKCRLSVPGGGLAERIDETEFLAPPDGYEAAIEIAMPAVPPKGQRWHSSIEKDLYIRLPNQTHARGRLFITIDPDLALVSFESWWNQNPDSSRNLEAGANWFGKAL